MLDFLLTDANSSLRPSIECVRIRRDLFNVDGIGGAVPSPIPQVIVFKVELREGGVQGQLLAYRPPPAFDTHEL